MHDQEYKDADGTKRCSITCLLRLNPNMVCVSAKNFEIDTLECQNVMLVSKVRKSRK